MYWDKVTQCINEATDRSLACGPLECLLGGFHRPAPKKVTNRFIDLALVLAKRQMTKYRKSKKEPLFEVCQLELVKWATAESEVFHGEAERGLRKPELPQAWDTMLLALRAGEE